MLEEITINQRLDDTALDSRAGEKLNLYSRWQEPISQQRLKTSTGLRAPKQCFDHTEMESGASYARRKLNLSTTGQHCDGIKKLAMLEGKLVSRLLACC